jgi:siroheme synthase (precorrin-2 oxidase/ferrochelatase)
MSLTSADLKQIEEHIKSNIGSWMGDVSLTKSSYFNEIELIERIVRVEEELKSQRELMLMGFEQMNKRFEQVDKRFEQVDKRFEQVDKRFEDVNSKFTMMFAFMTLGFTILATMMTVFKFLA